MKFFIKTGLIVIGLILFFWFWIFGNRGLYEMEQLRRVQAELLKEKASLEKEKENLEAELKHLDDPLYLKHLIHRELGYVEPGEVMVKFHGEKKNQAGATK